MGLDYCASSPTLVMPPQHPSHYLMHRSHDEVAMTDCFAVQSPPPKKFVPKIPIPPSMNYLAKSCNSAAGRKRSRADIGEEMDDEVGRPVLAASSPITPPESLPFGSSSEQSQNQTSTQLPTPPSSDVDVANRPRLVARKSQRRLESPEENSSLSNPEIDPIIRRLGIGWKQIQDAQSPGIAGQQAYIRNQYSFQEPQIILEHEGLGIFVVRSKPASAQGYWDQWWLFTEDLRSCRFLCHDETELFRRLDHKRQDERGNWQPDILVEGPIIRAKDATPIVDDLNALQNIASDPASPLSAVPTPQTEGDVEMQM